MANATWLTPGRHTKLDLLVQGPVALRPPWTTARRGPQISRAWLGANKTTGVQLQPGNGWTLKPLNEDISRILNTGGAGFGDAPVGAADVNLGANWESDNTFRKPTDLTGLTIDANMIASGSPAFYKRVPAGSSWNSNLAADVAAFPQPTLESADIAMDRMLTGKVTYPANTGFALVFRVPSGFSQIDTLLTFYFGGPNQVTPTGAHGGEFCVTVRGSGKAILFEKSGSSWLQRLEWSAFSGVQNNMAVVILRIWPYGRDTIALSGGSVDGGAGQDHFGFAAIVQPQPQRFATFYRQNPGVSGYRTVKSVTGAGPIRLDMRQDVRTFVQILRLRPPASGIEVDLPWWCPYPLPAGTHLTVTGDTFRPAGTDIAVQLYDAATNAALTPISTNVFLSVAGKQAYYARFTFTADANKEQTPVLWGYRIDVPVNTSSLAPVVSSAPVRHISATGPDYDVTHETANLEVQDPTNSYAILRSRGRIPARLAVYDDSNALTTVLLDGEVSLATGQKKGRPGRVYPSASWFKYDVTMVGVWARLAEAITLDLESFAIDDLAAEDATGQKPPWKITDILRHVLNRLGFPDAQLDIPDINIRIFPTEAGLPDVLLQPTVSPAEFIKDLCEKYLNMLLIWDPNAGSQGMWRLLFNPTAATLNVLGTFVGSPNVGNRLPAHPNSYPAGTAFIRFGSYHEEVKAPEGNFVLVVGADMTYPCQISSSMYNPVSFDFVGATSDPTHIDYMGRVVPIVHVDPLLATVNATNFVCRRIYNFACHGQKWLKWESPLLLVTDPNDLKQVRARPMRINDGAVVYGQNCVVRSVNPSYQIDGVQLANYEAVVVN